MSRLFNSAIAQALAVLVPLGVVVVMWRGGLVSAGVDDVLRDVSNRGPNEIAENERLLQELRR